MKNLRILIYPVLFIISFFSMEAQDLSSHQWKDRLLVILTNGQSSDLYLDQMNILNKDIDGLEERKLIIYSVLPERYKKGIHSEKWIKSTKLFDRFKQNGKDFEVILIGLDGGIKLRQSEKISTEKLFGTIDSMPMRRNEIRNKSIE